MTNVSEFACGRRHPQRSDIACVRKRWHAGDHRADTDDGGILEWSDFQVAGRRAGKTSMLDAARRSAGPPPPVLIGQTRDDRDVHEVEPSLEIHATGRWTDPVQLVAYAVLALLILCGPALVVGAYRWGF